MLRLSCLISLGVLFFAPSLFAQEVGFLQPPMGYEVATLSVGTGNEVATLAPDPTNENFIYAAGTFDGMARIVHISLADGQWTAVFDCPSTVAVAGFAVHSVDVIYISDNLNSHLYVLRDNNPQDGDFNDPGEITDLITPILTHPTFGWTGSAVLIVRSSINQPGLSAGTVLFQSEDGGTTEGEVLAVVDPLTSPSYQPSGGAYFSGLNYGGGMAIDSQGRLLVASSFWPDTGKIFICDDVSENQMIDDTGESNVIVPRASETLEWAGLSALAIDGEDHGYCSVGWGGFGSPSVTEIRTFAVPENPLSTTATVTTFGTLNSPYVYSVIFNSTEKTFRPISDNGATMVICACDDFYGRLDYLITVRPYFSLGVKLWTLY